MIKFINFFIKRSPEIGEAFMQHIKISGIAVLLAILIGVPLGICIVKSERLSKIVLSVVGLFQTVPSLAIFGLIIPLMGIGIVPAIFVLFLYSLLPIISNTYIGIRGVDESIIQAAIGMGMTNFQVLLKVKLPIAISVIMGGIKISAVANIGTTTIAALIGAGGLGELIFRGISTSNNNLVLSGAIPTAILAFLVSYVLGVFEKSLTPTGMLTNRNDKKKSILQLKVFSIVFLVIFSFRSYKMLTTTKHPTIIVGHKNYPEQRILGQMISELIEVNTKYKVNLIEFGSTNVILEALQNSDIDIYPEYTGTAYSAILGQNGETNPKKVFDIIKNAYTSDFGLDITNPMGFQNTYAFAIKPEFAKKYNLKTISDIKKIAGNITLSGPHEFMEREDGLLGIQKAYNLKFKDVLSMDQGLVITSLNSEKTEIGIVYSTDGLILKSDLILLKDDLNFFPPYEVVTTFRKEYDLKNPDIIEALNKLTGVLTETDMQKLNLEAIREDETLETNVRNFLKNKKIIN